MTTVEKLIVLTQKIRIRNLVYWLMMVICILNGSVFIYRLVFDIQHVTSLWQLGVPFEMALLSGIIGIMCEHNNRHNEKVMNSGLIAIATIIVANIAIMFATV